MAALSTGYRLFLLLFILPGCTEVHGWDSIDLELFDLVEEIKDNFYDVLGLKQVIDILKSSVVPENSEQWMSFIEEWSIEAEFKSFFNFNCLKLKQILRLKETRENKLFK